MKLKIFIPKKVAIYLPLYIAKEHETFEGYLKKHGITQVEIVPPVASEEGDIFAIKKMHDENNANNDTIAIAIADPASFLVSRNIEEKKDIRIIGALINKPPFWAIDHKEEELKEIGDFRKEFDVIIHNGEEYATGSLIGKRVRGKNEGIKSEIAGYGEEINKLKALPPSKRAVAITTDIISIAKATVGDNLKVNFNFAGDKSEFNYITTGILTSKKCCEKYPGILVDIIRVFKKTINDLSLEGGAVKLVLNQIAREVFDCDITNAEHKVIFKLFNGGNFYVKDLIVSPKLWKNAVALQVEIHHFLYMTDVEKQEKDRLIKDSFAKYVDNSFAFKANTFSWIRIFLAKHKIKRKTKKTVVMMLLIYVLLIASIIGFDYFVFNLYDSIEMMFAAVIFPVILAIIQKFGIDNIK